MKAIYIVVENSTRTDFYTNRSDGFEMPLVLTKAVSTAREHGVGYTEALENLAATGEYRPGLPVQDRMFENLKPETAAEMNDGFQLNHLIGQRVIFDFDNRKMSWEHDPVVCRLFVQDGARSIPDEVFAEPGRPSMSVPN